MTIDYLTIGSIHHIDDAISTQDIARIESIRDAVVLVSRYRPGRCLPVPLFVHDLNEFVQISSQELLQTELLSVPALSARLILTNRTLDMDASGHGIRTSRYLCCRLTARISVENRSGVIRRLRTDKLPSTSQASFRPRHLRLPEASLLEHWLQRAPVHDQHSAYTFGDAFCGAGGASRGAQLAGLKVVWGFDFDATAGTSFRANFARHNEAVVFYQIDAQNFITVPAAEVHVDVLHLSPSCQAFSTANTVAGGGQYGDYNRDSFLSCLAIINHVRPRVVTMEQVPGLLYNRSHNYFDTFLRDLVGLGFSIGWKVMSSEQFGVPQARKRLILVASCPGHVLPNLPQPSVQASRVNDYLRPSAQKAEFNGLWEGTVMTAGARRADGTGLSAEELAAIQSFPRDHIFVGSLSAIRRQIGNAVPPQLARNLFLSVLSCLARVSQASSNETILLE